MAQSALVDVVRGKGGVSHGVTARELLDLRGHRELLSAAKLERWLLEQGLAEPNGEPGRLVPTQRAYEIARDLRFLG